MKKQIVLKEKLKVRCSYLCEQYWEGNWFRMEQETRLTYSIKACSTEAPGYAAENLRDLASTGWRSTDLCDFPQSIICKLECESTLRKIQLLGHNFLIPQRVVLYIGNFNNKYEKHIWKKIGFVTFSDNANTNFKQRELKTINLKAWCLRDSGNQILPMIFEMPCSCKLDQYNHEMQALDTSGQGYECIWWIYQIWSVPKPC